MMLEKTATRGDSYFKSPSNKMKVYEMGKTYRTQVLDTKVVKIISHKRKNIGKPRYRWVKNKDLYETSIVYFVALNKMCRKIVRLWVKLLLPSKKVKIFIVAMEGKVFYKFRFLKHLMTNLASALNHGQLKVVTICVTEWGKWLTLFHI